MLLLLPPSPLPQAVLPHGHCQGPGHRHAARVTGLAPRAAGVLAVCAHGLQAILTPRVASSHWDVPCCDVCCALQGGPACLTGASDAEQKDQQPSADSKAPLSLLDKGSAASTAPSAGSTLLNLEAENDTLTLTSNSKVGCAEATWRCMQFFCLSTLPHPLMPACIFSLSLLCAQKQQSSGGGFSLGFGSIGRIGMRGSSSGDSKPAKVTVVSGASKAPVMPSNLLMAEADDDIPAFTSTALTTR